MMMSKKKVLHFKVDAVFKMLTASDFSRACALEATTYTAKTCAQHPLW